jgi:uncharacterized protein
MKKLLLILLCVPLIGLGQSEEEIDELIKQIDDLYITIDFGKYNEKGKRSGLWVEYTTDSIVQNIGYYLDGQKEGLWKENLAYGYGSQVNYKKGKQHGSEKGFYPNGQLQREFNYKNGVLVGEQKNWHKNGKIFGISNRNNEGELDGLQKSWWSTNGAILREALWEHGECIYLKTWDDKGNITNEIYHK